MLCWSQKMIPKLFKGCYRMLLNDNKNTHPFLDWRPTKTGFQPRQNEHHRRGGNGENPWSRSMELLLRRKCQEMVNQLVENLAQLVRAERLMEQGIPVDEAWNMTKMLANGLESPEWLVVSLFDFLVAKVQWIEQTAEQVHKLCCIWATQRWKMTK